MTEDVVYSVFFIIPEISLCNISGISTKAACEEMRLKRRARKGVYDFFCRLLLLAKKRFTRVNKDNDKHKRGTHKCPYVEELHDMKTLYKKFQKELELEIEIC